MPHLKDEKVTLSFQPHITAKFSSSYLRALKWKDNTEAEGKGRASQENALLAVGQRQMQEATILKQEHVEVGPASQELKTGHLHIPSTWGLEAIQEENRLMSVISEQVLQLSIKTVSDNKSWHWKLTGMAQLRNTEVPQQHGEGYHMSQSSSGLDPRCGNVFPEGHIYTETGTVGVGGVSTGYCMTSKSFSVRKDRKHDEVQAEMQSTGGRAHLSCGLRSGLCRGWARSRLL